MIGRLTQIQVKPEKENSKGELLNEKYASITVNIPLTDPSESVAIGNLISVLKNEDVEIIIKPIQLRLEIEGGDTQ